MPEYDVPALLREAVHVYVDSKRGSTLVGRAYDMSESTSRAAYEEEVYATTSAVLGTLQELGLRTVREHVPVRSASQVRRLPVMHDEGGGASDGSVDETARKRLPDNWFERRWDVC